MNDSGLVSGRQPAACGDIKTQDLLPRWPSFVVVDPLAQRLAGDELHRDVEAVLVQAGLVDLHDVRVIEAGQCLGFPHRPRAPLLAPRGAWPHELDRDPAIQRVVIGGQDDPHGAGAQLLQHRKPPDAYDPWRGIEEPRASLLSRNLESHVESRLGGEIGHGVAAWWLGYMPGR